MTKDEVVQDIVKKLGGFADLSPFERVLIEYCVEETIKKVVKK